MKKKLQIFVSSTYTDLIDERQAAVEAILRSGNIPAGMELFSAGSKSQLETIKKWILESDIYMLILGGRYGSIEPETKLSYTELEYIYASELGKPLFAIVLDDQMLENNIKIKGIASKKIHEFDNTEKYKKFKELVLSKICRICTDQTEIKLSILESIIDIQNQNDLSGWIKGDEIPDYSQLLNEIGILRTEKDELQNKVISLESLTKKTATTNNIGDYTFEEIKAVLSAKEIIIPSNLSSTKEDSTTNALNLMIGNSSILTTGVTETFSNDTQRFFVTRLIPILLNFNLVERQKVRNIGMKIEYDKFVLSALGNKFLSLFEIEKTKKKK